MSKQAIILGLKEKNAVKFGDFTLTSGRKSPFYIDLRLLASAPDLMKKVAKEYACILKNLKCDSIGAIPLTGLPIGMAVSLESGIPLIYPRDKAKAHGTSLAVEGIYKKGDRVVIIEDLATSGGSVIKGAEKLREAGLVVEDAIVLLDRQADAKENLAQQGINLHYSFNIMEMLDILHKNGTINDEKKKEAEEFVTSSY